MDPISEALNPDFVSNFIYTAMTLRTKSGFKPQSQCRYTERAQNAGPGGRGLTRAQEASAV